jgi:arylsulfatase A
MRRRDFLGAAAQPLLAAKGRPNIVVILTDDLGWAELGCYGNRFNETPNLDALAAQGVRFTQGYAPSPVCSPTRASYMTGQYPARVGINDYLRAKDPKFLSPDLPALPKLLAAAGYETALIGKWHLMGDYQLRPGNPARHGFKRVICSETAYIGPGYYFPPYQHMTQVAPRREGEYLTDRLNQEAVEWLSASASKPFFLCLNHYAPHTRLAGKADKVARYRAKPGAGQNRNNPELAAMLESIDEGVGAVMKKLDELKLAGNTILIFASDNGGELNVTSNAPLRGGKSMLYEGGIRVPLIVRWPGVARKGAECATPVMIGDFYPTLLEAAGLRPPQGHIVDGVSFAPVLENPDARMERDALYWYYPLEKPHFLGGRSSGAIRQGDWKLIEFYDKDEVELFNLRDDAGETRNRAAAEPARARRLVENLRAWRGHFRP